MLILKAKRNGYAPNQCGKTMTVGEMIQRLEEFDPNDKVFLSHDGGYTYGSISYRDFTEENEAVLNETETEDEEISMT